MSLDRFVGVAALAAVTGLGASVTSAAITIDWTTVGNAGNAADPLTGNLYGSVAYEYRIGTYEVTNAQYAAFLNAAATSDPNGLYHSNMDSDARGGIARLGSDGSYTYSVKPNMGDKPVNYVNWYDAARMANWMTNGQGGGSTEFGAYTFDGVESISAITRDLANPNQVFLPTEDEWYKAAYHQPAAQGGDADDYWGYPNSANTISWAQANFAGAIGNTAPVGSYAANFYGTLDMGGNVWEWTETRESTSYRVLRGGSFPNQTLFLQATFRSQFQNPGNHANIYGFRVTQIPSPSCPGDVNGDGDTNALDFNILAGNFGSGPGATPAQGDVNGDGFVNALDFNILAGDFGCGG